MTPGSGGGTPATLTVTVNPAGLGGGTVNGTITINVPGASNSPILVPVGYSLIAAPVIGSISPSSINAGSGDTPGTWTQIGTPSDLYTIANIEASWLILSAYPVCEKVLRNSWPALKTETAQRQEAWTEPELLKIP